MLKNTANISLRNDCINLLRVEDEAEVEAAGHLRDDLAETIKIKALEAGLYAANIPAEYGGAGLDTVTWLLYEKELGRANYALHWRCVARPSNILCAGTPEQHKKLRQPKFSLGLFSTRTCHPM